MPVVELGASCVQRLGQTNSAAAIKTTLKRAMGHMPGKVGGGAYRQKPGVIAGGEAAV